jgi:hypothetical protein
LKENEMTILTFARRGLCAAVALGFFSCMAPAAAQHQPSPNAIAMAKELMAAKGATAMFDPLVPGIVESTKNALVPANPSLFKDLNEVAAKLRTELASRRDEIVDEIARLYAQRFTEAEIKDVLAFYKSAVGKKFAAEEPAVIDQGLARAEAWSKKINDEVTTRFRVEMKKKGHDL